MSEASEQAYPGSPARRPKRWKGFALGVVILVCGVIIGSAGTHLLSSNFHLYGPPPEPGKKAERITEQLRRDLNLTDQQVVALRAIFEQSEREMEVIRANDEPEIEANFEKTRQLVEAQLTPEQARLWEEHVAKMRERRAMKHPGPPPPPPTEEVRKP